MISTAASLLGQVVKDIQTATPNTVLVPRNPLWQPPFFRIDYTMPLKGTQGRVAASTHTLSTSQTQAEAQIDPFDTNNEAVNKADVAQLKQQMRTLAQAQKDDQDTLKLILN